ncbi:hypothetical protein FIBSPDRAFT_942545 [Athelia psychrophila]|uniref:CUE domain-containing protein n=1 Tax=Athelia psychrophila TaxID=1759441 RepID=A0A166X4R1_9AGAM|nr:hypothetical protein FIBSPDRAFT_942545 [Fibularhizoctonia sp. CBS 109695]
MTTDNAATSPTAHEFTTTPAVAETALEAAPAAPQAISGTADAAAIKPLSSPPPTSEPPQSMTAAQDSDSDAESLPEMPGPLPRESSIPTANSVPTVDPNQLPADPPEVASLKAMFPDFDSAVLQSVLESCGGSHERAIDMLLGMSDPEYVSQHDPVPAQSQTELDEQFARQLMMEDEQQQHRRHEPPFNGQARPRARGEQWQQQQPQQQQQPVEVPPGGQKDTMAQIQEQAFKIADTGKKTFSSFLTKAKAKLQEFDQQRQEQRTGQGSTPGGTQPSWGDGNQQQYQAPQQHYGQAPAQVQPAYRAPPPQQAQPSYYDPNAQPTRQDSFTSAQGYDATPLPSAQAAAAPSSAALSTTAVAGSAATTPSASTDRPPSTSSGAPPIDPSKLGMLPKRPVSLVRDPSQPPARHEEDEDDELEYAENPFEEHR